MRKAFKRGAWSLLCMLTLAGTTLATTEKDDSTAFLARLSELHQHQQELNSLAEQQAHAAEIVELADSIAVDHQLLNEWLLEAGHEEQQHSDDSAYGDDEQQQAYEELQPLEGAEFDRQFLEYQEAIHRQALNQLQENRPQNIAASEQANHLKITHETLRKHLGLIQQHRQENAVLSESD